MEQTTTQEWEVGGVNDGQLLRTVVEDPAYNTTFGYLTSVTRTVTQPGVTGAWVSTTDYGRSNPATANIITPTVYCLGLPVSVRRRPSSPQLALSLAALREVDTVDVSTWRIDGHVHFEANVGLKREWRQ